MFNPRQIFQIIEALLELFLTASGPSAILPSNRKLQCFEHRKFIHVCQDVNGLPEDVLFLLFIEDAFCRAYADIVAMLHEKLYHDVILKHRALTTVTQCIIKKPEQEHRLLTILIDKLGDTDKQTTAKVIQQIFHLIESHPAMTGVIIDHLWSYISSRSIFPESAVKKAKSTDVPGQQHHYYYALVTLTQIPCLSPFRQDTKEKSRICSKLFSYYVKLLQWFMKADEKNHLCSKKNKNKGQSPEQKVSKYDRFEKVAAMIIHGIRKIIPCMLKFSQKDESTMDVLKTELSVLYSLIDHSVIPSGKKQKSSSSASNWNQTLQTLSLLFQIIQTLHNAKGTEVQSFRDKFIKTIQGVILDGRVILTSLNRQFHFLQLIRRILQEMILVPGDNPCNLGAAWIIVHRLLQVSAICHEPSFICYVLGMFWECMQTSGRFLIHVKQTYLHKEHEKIDLGFPYIFGLLMHHYHPSVRKMAGKILGAISSAGGGIQGCMIDLDSMNEFESLSVSNFMETITKRHIATTKAIKKKKALSKGKVDAEMQSDDEIIDQ